MYQTYCAFSKLQEMRVEERIVFCETNVTTLPFMSIVSFTQYSSIIMDPDLIAVKRVIIIYGGLKCICII